MSGRAKRGLTPREDPLNDFDLISKFRQSHPLHAHILFQLQNSMEAKRDATITWHLCRRGSRCSNLKSRLIRTLPAGVQLLVRIMPTFAVCMTACSELGAHVGHNWVKYPHEAEAKFHHRFQNTDQS